MKASFLNNSLSFSFSFYGARWGTRPQVSPSPVSCGKKGSGRTSIAYQMNTTGRYRGSGGGR